MKILRYFISAAIATLGILLAFGSCSDLQFLPNEDFTVSYICWFFVKVFIGVAMVPLAVKLCKRKSP